MNNNENNINANSGSEANPSTEAETNASVDISTDDISTDAETNSGTEPEVSPSVDPNTKPKKEKGKHKVRNRVIIICIIVVVALCAIGYGVGFYFSNYALARADIDAQESIEESLNYATYGTELDEYNLGADYYATTTSTSITSEDGLNLYADMTRNEDSHVWVIVIHGYQASNLNMMNYGVRYADRGYNVLLPDNRAHDKSEGQYIGMGWLDRKDIECWIDWIVEQDEDAEIMLHGVSMGGATTMMVSGDNPEHVIGYIEDCGYTTVWDIFASELEKRFGLPTFPVLNLASFVSMIQAGYTFEEASSVEQVAKCEEPMLFIHGEDDDFVPVEMGLEVYEAANCEKELYLVEGAGHAASIYKDPDAYWDTVFNFIDTVIKP